MNKTSTFAKRLRELLDIQHITQTELSHKTGISKSSISHYLKGDWEAKPDTIYTISQFVNINESWLMGYDVPMNKFNMLSNQDICNAVNEMIEPAEAMTFLSRFAALSKDDRHFLMETLDLLLIRRSLSVEAV